MKHRSGIPTFVYATLPAQRSRCRVLLGTTVLVAALLTTACGRAPETTGAAQAPLGTVLPAAGTTPTGIAAASAHSSVHSTPTPDATVEALKKRPCPRLGDTLYHFLHTSDRAAFAAQQPRESSFGYDGKSVEVAIILAGPEGDLPQCHGFQVLGRLQNSIKARVPVETLCSLSDDPRVSAVDVVARTTTK
jgi:hypothetical protein